MKGKAITMDKKKTEQEMCRCGKPAEFDYFNKVSRYHALLCRRCLENLRRDVSADEWIRLGIAEPIFKRVRALGEGGE